MNKVYVIGRLTADPVLNEVSGASCCNFTVAADTRAKDKDGKTITNFYRMTAWRALGDTCAKYLHKGDQVAIGGDQVFQSYLDKTGQQRMSVQVTVTDFEFVGGKRSTSSDTANAASPSDHSTDPNPNTSMQTQPQTFTQADDDSLPF